MSEMVERVAAALRIQSADESGDPDGEQYWQRQAHAAIAAMREPTEAMYFAALRAMPEIKPGAQHPVVAWRAMIDTALA